MGNGGWKALVLAPSFVGILASACGSGGSGDVDPGEDAEFAGVAQKGPFIRGTEIVVSELDPTLRQTGRTFIGEIMDNTGRFEVRATHLGGPYARLSANGFYFNEVLGKVSAAPLALTALVPIAGAANVNVNILTDLETPRVEYLVQHGSSVADAKRQAQSEVLQAFMMGVAGAPTSETLDIARASNADAALLAVSVLLQGYLEVGELSEALSTIAADLRQDGTLDDGKARALVMNAATLVAPAAIRQHLEQRYAELGIPAAMGSFESYITGFRDQDPDPYVSRLQIPAQGIYGPNLLDSAVDQRTAGTYSLSATSPVGQPLRVRLTWTGPETLVPDNSGLGWWISDQQNWAVTLFDFTTGTQDFTAIDTGSPSHFNVRLAGSGSMRIEIFEGDSVSLTSSRTLAW